MPNKTKKRRAWFRYDNGESDNRTICWSERQHDRTLLFPHQAVKKLPSISLAKQLDKINTNLKMNPYTDTQIVTTVPPGLSPGVKAKPNAFEIPLSTDELPFGPNKQSDKPQAEPPTTSELTKAKIEANDAINSVKNVASGKIDSLQTAARKGISGVYNQGKDKLLDIVGNSKERMNELITNVQGNIKNTVGNWLGGNSGGGRRTRRNGKRRRKRQRRRRQPKKTRRVHRR